MTLSPQSLVVALQTCFGAACVVCVCVVLRGETWGELSANTDLFSGVRHLQIDVPVVNVLLVLIHLKRVRFQIRLNEFAPVLCLL